ncbi:helix-turn-helix domain-containing protein [Ruminiclostridium cellobioparum]|uniref:helix-turn-helix domain-containing protein n=1 Tax=Ruminiclostridium cellobioparum TaxID=29355 RepID=UPI0028A58D86|nr:helix-turn-helix transcriptional regulator [Ruminiclostridium cellobioparum]
MDDIRKVLGDRIRILRIEKGLSLEKLGERANITPFHLGRLERGEKTVKIDSLEKIVSGLDTTFEDLFKYIQPSKGDIDNTTLSLLMNKLSTLSIEEQKLMLKHLDVMFELMKHKA